MIDERNSTIGQRIKTLRTYRNISLEELANATGKNRVTIYRYEMGEIDKIPYGVLCNIAKCLGVSLHYLTCEDEKTDADLFSKLRKDEADLVNLIITNHGKLNESETNALELIISSLVEKRTPVGEGDCAYKKIVNQGPQEEKISSLDYKKNRKSNL